MAGAPAQPDGRLRPGRDHWARRVPATPVPSLRLPRSPRAKQVARPGAAGYGFAQFVGVDRSFDGPVHLVVF